MQCINLLSIDKAIREGVSLDPHLFRRPGKICTINMKRRDHHVRSALEIMLNVK
jgi:hypothetical protein